VNNTSLLQTLVNYGYKRFRTFYPRLNFQLWGWTCLCLPCLRLRTRHKQLLGYLPLAFGLNAECHRVTDRPIESTCFGEISSDFIEAVDVAFEGCVAVGGGRLRLAQPLGNHRSHRRQRDVGVARWRTGRKRKRCTCQLAGWRGANIDLFLLGVIRKTFYDIFTNILMVGVP